MKDVIEIKVSAKGFEPIEAKTQVPDYPLLEFTDSTLVYAEVNPQVLGGEAGTDFGYKLVRQCNTISVNVRDMCRRGRLLLCTCLYKQVFTFRSPSHHGERGFGRGDERQCEHG